MGRRLAALATFCLILGPAWLEGRGGDAPFGHGPDGPPAAAAGTFSLARGVIGGAINGAVDGAFLGSGNALCFLPGTFEMAVDGTPPGEFRPSSHCGYDATVRIDAFADVAAGDQAARSMAITWTDLAGRTYTLRFDAGEYRDGHDVRVLCLGATEAECHSAVVDTLHAALASDDGLTHDTGSRARLILSAGPDVSEPVDLGVYDVPFTLTID